VENTPARGGQLRGNIEDGFAIGDQALGDVSADTVAALDRPHAIRVLAAGGEHGLVAVAIGAKPAFAEDAFALVDDLDSGGTLVRIHPDDDLGHLLPLLSSTMCRREGSATLSWAVP
jgi:hypothetical protein